MTVDCSNVASDTLTAACLQAQSAVDSANILADAATWQGWLTFAAGVLAAVGGYLAYLAATRESRRLQDTDRAKVSAYRFMMLMKAESLLEQAAVNYGNAKEELSSYKDGDSGGINLYHFVVPPEFMPDQFERHALLGTEGQRAVHNAYEAVHEAYSFADKMRGKTVNEPYGIKEESRKEHADGSVSFDGDIAISQKFKIGKRLLDSTKELHRVLRASDDAR